MCSATSETRLVVMTVQWDFVRARNSKFFKTLLHFFTIFFSGFRKCTHMFCGTSNNVSSSADDGVSIAYQVGDLSLSSEALNRHLRKGDKIQMVNRFVIFFNIYSFLLSVYSVFLN